MQAESRFLPWANRRGETTGRGNESIRETPHILRIRPFVIRTNTIGHLNACMQRTAFERSRALLQFCVASLLFSRSGVLLPLFSEHWRKRVLGRLVTRRKSKISLCREDSHNSDSVYCSSIRGAASKSEEGIAQASTREAARSATRWKLREGRR